MARAFAVRASSCAPASWSTPSTPRLRRYDSPAGHARVGVGAGRTWANFAAIVAESARADDGGRIWADPASAHPPARTPAGVTSPTIISGGPVFAEAMATVVRNIVADFTRGVAARYGSSGYCFLEFPERRASASTVISSPIQPPRPTWPSPTPCPTPARRPSRPSGCGGGSACDPCPEPRRGGRARWRAAGHPDRHIRALGAPDLRRIFTIARYGRAMRTTGGLR